MNKLSKLSKRHRHYWVDISILERGWPDPHTKFECSVCRKTIIKRPSERPVNPIVPTAWEVYEAKVSAGNAHLVMRPPTQLGIEPDYVEGARYAQLVKEYSLP